MVLPAVSGKVYYLYSRPLPEATRICHLNLLKVSTGGRGQGFTGRSKVPQEYLPNQGPVGRNSARGTCAQGWRNDSRGGGTRLWGPREKGSSSVSKGPKPPIQLLQLLKNSPREVKRAHFRYILVPPGSTQEVKLMGPGGKVPPGPPPPGFSSHACAEPIRARGTNQNPSRRIRAQQDESVPRLTNQGPAGRIRALRDGSGYPKDESGPRGTDQGPGSRTTNQGPRRMNEGSRAETRRRQPKLPR